MTTPFPVVSPRTRADRIRSIIQWLSITVIAWSLIGCVIVPLLLKHVAIPQLNKRLNGRASVERVKCDPFSLGLTLRAFRLEDASGRPVLTFDRFEGNFEVWASLFKGGWRFDHVRAHSPTLAVEVDKQGAVGWLQLLKEDPAAKPSDPIRQIPRLVIRDLRVFGAGASFTDLSTPEVFSKRFEGAEFSIENLDTHPDHTNPHILTARTASGETVRWTGTFSVDPLSSAGQISIENWALPEFVPYSLRYSQARVKGGTLAATIDYEFAPARAPRAAKATVRQATIKGLTVMQPDGALVEAPAVELKAAVLDADARTLRVESVVLDRPAAHVRRDAAGVMNIETILAAPLASGGVRRADRPDVRSIQYPLQQLNEALLQLVEDIAGGWDIAVSRVELRDAGADWADKAMGTPVDIRASSVKAVLGPIASADRFRTPVQLSAVLGGSGKAEVSGILLPMDGAAEIKAALDGVDLAFLAPYLPETMAAALPAVRLVGAVVSLNGDAKVQIVKDQPSSASWSGELSLASLRVDSAAGGAPVASAERLVLRGDAAAQGVGRSLRSASWKGEIDAAKLAFDAPALAKGALASAKIATEEAGASVDESGGMAFAWKGKLNADVLAVDTTGDAPATVKAAALSLEGAARAAVTGGRLMEAAWSGLTGATGLDASVSGAMPISATMENLAVSGDATVSGDAPAAEWKGLLRAGGVKLHMGGANESHATIGTLTLDGKAQAPLNAGAKALAWSGAANLVAVVAKVGGPVAGEATIETLAITGDSRAEVSEAGVQGASWKGELTVAGVNALAMPENPAKVSLATATVKGEAAAAGLAGGTPDLRFAGDANTGALEFESRQRGALKARMESFSATSATLSSGEKSVQAAEVLLQRPVFTVNAALLPPPRSEETKGVLKQAILVRLREMILFKFKLGHVLVTDASYEVRDETSTPPLILIGQDGRFELTNLSNDGASLAEIKASLRTQESGQVRLIGKVDLFRPKPFADLKVDVAAMPLKPFDAVSGRYVGYLIDQGRAAATLPIMIDDGKLKGTLNFDLDSLDLGDSTNSAEAPNVPLELGLALLTDSDDHVKGSIPISGNIDEPGFSVGGLVWQAFLNLIVKAATAPFQILGALLDAGEGEDLSVIVFDAGAASMPPESLSKLDKLARGLADRPSLKLDIIGRIGEAEDLPALKRQALREQLLARAGGNAAALTDEQHLQGVLTLYHESRGEAVPRLRTGEAPPTPLPEMEAAMLASVSVDPQRLAGLAAQRAESVRNVLIKDNVVGADRVTIIEDPEDQGEIKSPRADLRLRQ